VQLNFTGVQNAKPQKERRAESKNKQGKSSNPTTISKAQFQAANSSKKKCHTRLNFLIKLLKISYKKKCHMPLH